MALDPLVWAMRSAPVADTEEWAVLAVMAESADQDGCNAFQATATIAERARLSPRTVQRRIDDMTARGLIAAGDQQHRKLLEIPAHKRPVNYDLLIPKSWWGDVRWEETNRWRAQQGRKALRPSDRPDIGDAPAKARRAPRSGQGGASASQGVSGSHPLTTGHPVTPSPERGDSQSGEGCQAVTQPTPQTLPGDTPHLFVVSADADPTEADDTKAEETETAAEQKPAKAQSTAQGHRLPDDFTPSQAMQDWAAAHAPLVGWDQHQEFMDHWLAQPGIKGRKTDWVRTWRNWMRKAQRDLEAAHQRRGYRRASGSPRPHNSDVPEGW